MGLGAVGANGEEGRKGVRLTREALQPGTGVRYLKGVLFSIDLKWASSGHNQVDRERTLRESRTMRHSFCSAASATMGSRSIGLGKFVPRH
jgi:hypothetical protein